jgi:hypothetical protein
VSVTTTEADFAPFDGKRVAVSLLLPSGRRTVCGLAAFDCDAHLGNVLRVTMDGDFGAGNAQILLRESHWRGRIIPDVKHGCECLLIVEASGGGH